jgi:hypothetical protein
MIPRLELSSFALMVSNNAPRWRSTPHSLVTMWTNFLLLLVSPLLAPQRRGFVHNYPREFNDLASCHIAT